MIRNKDFMLLFLGRFITNFGDSIYLIATMSLVFSLSGSTFYTGSALFLTSSMAIFQVILSPILDRINMKKFLIVSQILQGVLLLMIPYLQLTDRLTVYHILIIMPIISLINQLVYPGQLALLPKIVEPSDLVKANSLFSIAYQGSDAVFNALSGFIISVFGFVSAYYIDSATFFINAILFIFLSKIVSEKNVDQNLKPTIKSHFEKLKSGLELWQNSVLKALLAGIILINFSATAIFATLPEFSSDHRYYGILLSASGVGVLLGAMISNFDLIKKKRLGMLYILFIVITALCWIIMALTNVETIIGKVIAFLTYLIGWILIGVLNIYSQTMVQMIVPSDKISVALSSMIGISVALAPLGALSAGFISRYYSAEEIIVFAAGSILMIGIYWYFNKSVRDIESLEVIGGN